MLDDDDDPLDDIPLRSDEEDPIESIPLIPRESKAEPEHNRGKRSEPKKKTCKGSSINVRRQIVRRQNKLRTKTKTLSREARKQGFLTAHLAQQLGMAENDERSAASTVPAVQFHQKAQVRQLDAFIAIETAYTVCLERVPRRALCRIWKTAHEMGGQLLGYDGFETLLNRKDVRKNKMVCADFVLHRELEVVDALLRCDTAGIQYSLDKELLDSSLRFVVAQCWLWDEAQQHIGMCTGIPLTKEYVRAVQNETSTRGIPMSIMQQFGRLRIDLLQTAEESNLFNETIVCGLESLESNNTNCTVQSMAKYRKLNSASDCILTRRAAFVVQVLLSDGHSACSKTKKFEVARRRKPKHADFSFNSVLELLCQCHNVHLASGEQSSAFNTSKMYCNRPSDQGREQAPPTAPLPLPAPALAEEAASPGKHCKGRGKGGKGKAKGKGGSGSKASQAKDHPAPKPQAKAKVKTKNKKKAARNISFITSMVRGANLLNQGRNWKSFCNAVPVFVQRNLTFIDRSPSESDKSHMSPNRILLRTTTLDRLHAEHKDRKAMEDDIEELLSLIGCCPWRGDAKMLYFLSDVERLLDDVHAHQLQSSLVTRISDLVRRLLLRTGPMEPSASRWTGVPQASLWNAGTLLFFNIQRRILVDHLGWKPRVPESAEHQAGDIMAAEVQAAADGHGHITNRQWVGTRKSLYILFLDTENAALLCLTFVFCNAPLRHVLGFLFASNYDYDKKGYDANKLKNLWGKYLLNPGDISFDEETTRDIPPITTWASGKVTGKCLNKMAQVLLGTDDANAVVTIANVLGYVDVLGHERERERMFCIVRRAQVKGASWCWWKCHMPATNLPISNFQIADPSLKGAATHHLLAIWKAMRTGRPCCLGVFNEDMKQWAEKRKARGDAESAIVDDVRDGMLCTARITPLATFTIEREHGETHKDTKAAKSLGNSLRAPDLSAIHVLRRSVQYNVMI